MAATSYVFRSISIIKILDKLANFEIFRDSIEIYNHFPAPDWRKIFFPASCQSMAAGSTHGSPTAAEPARLGAVCLELGRNWCGPIFTSTFLNFLTNKPIQTLK